MTEHVSQSFSRWGQWRRLAWFQCQDVARCVWGVLVVGSAGHFAPQHFATQHPMQGLVVRLLVSSPPEAPAWRGRWCTSLSPQHLSSLLESWRSVVEMGALPCSVGCLFVGAQTVFLQMRMDFHRLLCASWGHRKGRNSRFGMLFVVGAVKGAPFLKPSVYRRSTPRWQKAEKMIFDFLCFQQWLLTLTYKA